MVEALRLWKMKFVRVLIKRYKYISNISLRVDKQILGSNNKLF